MTEEDLKKLLDHLVEIGYAYKRQRPDGEWEYKSTEKCEGSSVLDMCDDLFGGDVEN